MNAPDGTHDHVHDVNGRPLVDEPARHGRHTARARSPHLGADRRRHGAGVDDDLRRRRLADAHDGRRRPATPARRPSGGSNAKITITPNATNEVGQPHTFTVTLQKDIGDGAGFVAAPGEHVDVTLTDASGAVHTAPTGTCTTAGANTDAAGQCTITFTSNTAGTVTGHATATVSVAGSAPFTVATNGVAPNGADAVKTFVDANIQITPGDGHQPGRARTTC